GRTCLHCDLTEGYLGVPPVKFSHDPFSALGVPGGNRQGPGSINVTESFMDALVDRKVFRIMRPAYVCKVCIDTPVLQDVHRVKSRMGLPYGSQDLPCRQ